MSDVEERLPAFDALLLSSLYEGVPAALIAALACGLEVVAADCGAAIRPLLRKGRLGRIVPVRDEAAFAGAVSSCRPGAQDLDESLAQARRFCVEKAADRYLGCFARLARHRRPAIAGQGDAPRPITHGDGPT
jgi:glycosyltransferase involved in cell wall biosynthesis